MPRLTSRRTSSPFKFANSGKSKRRSIGNQRNRRAQLLSLELLETRNLLAQLTVITHGRMDQLFDTPDVAPEWAFDMASAISARDGLGYTQTQIDKSVVRYDAASNGVPTGSAPEFLIFNWAEISDVDSPGKADDTEVAGKLADLVRARFPADNSPLDIHFIGHSRGSIVTLATINRLNNASDNAHIGNLRMTTLDPQDYGIPGINTEDVALTVPSNVDYAENYYQYMFPLGGGKIEGADVNENLTVRLALWDGRSVTVGAEHLEVVDRYYWSIDTNDVQAASYLRDDDLVEQQTTFMTQNAANTTQLRDLLYGPDPLDQAVALLKSAAQEFSDGVGEYFSSVSTHLAAAFAKMEVPIIGDQLAKAVEPMTEAMQSFGADARDVLEDIIDFAAADGGLHLVEALQGGIYMLLGPGLDGLDELTPEAQSVLTPLASTIDAIHLGLLLDGPDLGDDITPSDIVISFGNDIGNFENVDNPFWAQVDFRLGQFMTVDLPKFDIGLGSITEFISDSASAEQLQNFLNDFGFAITSDAGLRANLRWDLRFGAGFSALPSQRFYLNSAATTSGLGTGDPVEELRASITVFAAPPNESETFAEALFDKTTTENLRSNISLGLMQAEITDGTPTVVKVTAAEGLDIQVIDLLQDFSGEFDIIVNENETIHINYDPPSEETLPQFLLGLNAKLIEHYATPIPPLSFTLDFGSIHRAANPDVPTTPSLVLVAHSSEIHHLTIEGAEEYKFLAVQHEDHRSKTLGFGNNTASTAAGSTQRLVAAHDAPAEGVTMERPDFVLWIGGQRVRQDGIWVTTGATPVVVAESIDADVSTLSGLAASLALLNQVEGLEGFRSAVEDLIQNLVSTTSSYLPETVTVELQGDKLVLVSHAVGGLSAAPLLTITYHAIEPTKLTLVAGIDVTDPNYNELIEDENDQRTYNRLTKAEISANDFFDVFVPVLKAEAAIRLHVDTNADNITGFLEQNLGLGEGAISLPKIGFDFKLDAAVDFTTLFAGDPEADDIFVIDALQFDNVTLDVSQLLQSIVVPLAQAAVGAVEPILDVVGHSADDVDALLNKRLPVISDIVREDITVKDILAGLNIDDDIESFISTLQQADELGTTVETFVNSQEFRDAVGASGNFSLGGWELVMNPDSPLYFPRTELPVPIDFAYAVGSASELGLESFTHVFTAFDRYTPGGFKIDLFGPKTILNMAIGKPFNIVSFGLPKIDADAEASFGFEYKDLSVDIAGDAAFNSNLRLVYDSYGLAQIVSALRSGADPDWTDLLDGFAIQNDPDGYELGGHVGFSGSGSIGPIMATDPVSGDEYIAFEAGASIELYAELGLELVDPNNDGKFRLDEIFDLTDNFTQPQNLFCMFDVQGSFSVDVSGYATVLGVDLGEGSMGLSTGDFSLQDLLSSAFGICTTNRTPILAQETTENGLSVLRINVGPYAGSRLNGDTSDNTPDPFTHIIELPDGSALLVDQSGEELLFTAPESGNVYGSPDDDDSTLKKVGGVFEREFRGGTVHRFNANNAIAEIDNQLSAGETYHYDSLGRLQSINHSDGTTSNYYPDINLTVRTSADGVLISGYGVTDQLYTGSFAKIIATGSSSNDTLDFSGVVGIPVELDGLSGNDVLLGGSANDILVGGAGNDTLAGGAGNDYIDAGGGSNTVSDGTGDDIVDMRANTAGFVLTTGGGNDTVYGSAFADTISAPTDSTNNFHFEGGAGNDILTGALGNDMLLGGEGDDQLTSLDGNDALSGGYGHDILDAGAGNDALDGGQGNDTLLGGTGIDTLSGRQGDDWIVAGLSDVLVDGGTGDDHLIFRVDERAHIGSLTNFAYEETGQAAIPYLGMESLAVELGTGTGTAFQTLNNYVLTISGPTLPLKQILGGSGSDLVTIASLPGGAFAPVIDLGAGDDRFTVLDTQRALDLRGGDDGSNGDELIINRATDLVARAGTLSSTQITGLGLSNITYQSFRRLNLLLGQGFDQFTILSTDASTDTTISGGGGDDRVMIASVGGETIVNGDSGFDTASVIIPGDPNQVTAANFAELTFSVETLEVDNRANPAATAAWIFNSGRIYVGTAPTATLILDTLGADKTVFLGGGANGDTLTVQDDVNVPQTVNIDATSVEIIEGRNVLNYQANKSFTGFSYTAIVDGLSGVEDTVFSPDGLYVYAIARSDRSVTVFRRTAADNLEFVQILKDGQFGVDGLDGPTDIVISPDADGRYVYISSDGDQAVATFERIPATGRLVYRGMLVDSNHQDIEKLAINPSGTQLYAATKDSLLRLLPNAQTGLLTLGEKVQYAPFEPTGLAIGTDGRDLFASTTTGLRQWHLDSAGALPGTITSTANLARAYFDVATAINGSQKQVHAIFDGGIATYNYGASLGTATDRFHVNSTNKALGTALAVDPDDANRIVASFDKTSVDASAATYTLTLTSIYAEGDGQDLNDGNLVTPGWELYAKVNGVMRGTVKTDFDNDGQTKSLNIAINVTDDVLLEFWEDDGSSGDDLLVSTTISIPPGSSYTNYLEYQITEALTGSLLGKARLNYSVTINSSTTPTTQPITIFDRLSNGTLEANPTLVSNPYVNKYESLAVSPVSSDFIGTSSGNNLLSLFGDNHLRTVRDGELQSNIPIPAQPGADDVQTVFSYDGRQAYSISAKYGTIAVYQRDSGTGVLGNLIQVIPAGLLSGASIAVPPPVTRNTFTARDFVYVTNPAEDSLQVYERNNTPGSANQGLLTLVQVFTDGVNGIDGLAGASRIVFSEDFTPVVYVAGRDDDAIAAFTMNETDGTLTFVQAFRHADLQNPSAMAIITTPSQIGIHLDPFLYVTSADNDSLLVLSRSGGLSHVQTITNGTGDAMEQPAAVAISHDPLQLYVYVASPADSAITVFERDAFAGTLTKLQTIREGVNGVSGIAGVTSLSIDLENTHLIATSGEDTVAVFSISSGLLTIVQRLRDGANLVTGINHPQAVTIFGNDVYISSGGAAVGAGGISLFDIDRFQAPGNHYLVEYAGMEALTVQSAGQSDTVNAGEVTIPLTLRTLGGSDFVTLRNTPAGKAANITLGDGDDTLDLLTTGVGSTTTIHGSAGADRISIFATASGATTQITGDDDEDTFLVKGGRLGSNVTITGGGPTSPTLPGDTLIFDAQMWAANPLNPPLPNGFVGVSGPTLPYRANYTEIETIIIISSPLADAGGPYTISEGQSLSLSAAASQTPAGHTDVTYRWSIGAYQGVSDSATPTITWEKLRAAGVIDSGIYQVSVTITSQLNGETFSDTDVAQLTILNTAPTLGISGNNSVEVGQPYQIELGGSDPGDDAIDTWRINWGDGSPIETVYGQPANAIHSYDASGIYSISVLASDEDGTYPAITKTVRATSARFITGEATAIEGTPYSLTLANPSAASISFWTIHWGDGSVSSFSGTSGGEPLTVTHRYADEGAYQILATTLSGTKVSAVDSTVNVSVRNAAPKIDSTQVSSPALQGSPALFTIVAIDPGTLDTLTYEFDFDNNGVFESTSASSESSHVFTAVGTFTVPVRVRDNDGGVSNSTNMTVQVNNVAPTIQSVDVGRGLEGSLVRIAVNATDPGGNDDRLTYEFDFDNNGTYEVSGGAEVANHVFADNGVYPVRIRVSDENNGVATRVVNVTVENVAPFFTPGSASGRVLEGTPTVISISGSDPAGIFDPLTYAFDLDRNGSYETISTTGIVTYTFPDDSQQQPNDEFVIPVRITDGDGGVTNTTIAVNVGNVAPTIALSGASQIGAGETFKLNLGRITDPGTDSVTSYIVRWGDGTQNIYTAGGDVTHVYQNLVGEQTIEVSLVDEDGTHPAAGQHRVLVTGAALVDGTLFIFGGDCDDKIVISLQGTTKIKVDASFLSDRNYRTYDAAAVQRIVIYANGGDDRVVVASNIKKTVIIDGGTGEDLLNGGGGRNVLLGGRGEDHLIGGSGNDILIGGKGEDKLEAQSGQDVLIGGSSTYDSNLMYWRALDSLLARWNTAPNYLAGVTELRTPASSSAARLAAWETVFADDDEDDLNGGSELDWYFADIERCEADRIRGLARNELVDEVR